jgi:hypothetical protein
MSELDIGTPFAYVILVGAAVRARDSRHAFRQKADRTRARESASAPLWRVNPDFSGARRQNALFCQLAGQEVEPEPVLFPEHGLHREVPATKRAWPRYVHGETGV